MAMLAAWPSLLVLGAPTDVPSDVYSAGGLTLLTYNDLSSKSTFCIKSIQ